MLSSAVSLSAGCSSIATSNTSRTYTEQLLISEAVDQSLNKVDFSPLYGQHVYVEEKYLDCVDKSYVTAEVRHRAMRSGAVLVDSADKADVVMEMRSGGVGTASSESFVGIPEIALPGMLTIPEIRIAERKRQNGFSKLGLVIYDARSGGVLGDGGLSMAQSDDNNWFVLGVGPIKSGSLQNEFGKAQMRPMGMYRRALPTTVAFDTRKHTASPLMEDQGIEFASDTKVTPVE